MASRWRLVALLGVFSVGGCTGAAPPPRPPLHIRLATGTQGGGFYGFGQAIGSTIERSRKDLRVDVVASAGAVANVEAIQRGDVDAAFTFADVAYLASVGGLGADTTAYDQLRAIGVIQITPVQLLAGRHTSVRTVADLAGLRVAVGPEGSGTALTAGLILKAFGLRDGAVRTESLEFQEAGNRLIAGTLDAMFDTATYADSIARALKAGAHRVAIEGPPVERLRREYPFLRIMRFPGETPAESFRTLGVDSLLVCRRDLSDDVVHTFASAVFEALGTLAQTGRWNLAGPDDAPAAPIPLHDGAARYYREQELMR